MTRCCACVYAVTFTHDVLRVQVDETQWFPPEEEHNENDDVVEFSDEEEDMDDSERVEHQQALKKARLRRLSPKDQTRFGFHGFL